MAIRKKTSTTRLPQSLQQQIDEAASTSAYDQSLHPRTKNRRKSYFAAASRKDTRKQERLDRKQNKAAYFSSSHTSNIRKRGAQEELVESPQRKKPKLHGSNTTTVPPKVAKSRPAQPVVQDNAPSATFIRTDAAPSIKVSKKLTTVTKSLAFEILKKKISTVKLKPSPREDKEDAYIAYLESKLGMDKGGNKKGKKAAEEEDGLDDLMAWADSFVAPVTESEEESGDGNAESLNSESVSEKDSDDYDDDEWHGIGESVELPDLDLDEGDTPKSSHPATSSAYIPPHLRIAQSRDDSNSEIILKLTRQLKGLLNRMGEQNIGTILDGVEQVYRSHRRNDVTATLTTLVIDGISSHSSLLDSYVVLYAAFVSSLHKIVGVEFAAHLVQTLVVSYERHYASIQDTSISSTDNTTEQDGKECLNLLVLISELYNFHVVSSVLVFDVIRHLLSDDLTEFKVELLLKILRNSGQQLRQDDPSALKDIIEIVQRKVSIEDDGVNSRTRFMVETLINLKNNKSKRNATQNQGGAAVDRMKKFLSNLSKTRHVLAHEPLRVSLEDLHLAESKGKWWLVGAAWGGDPLVDKQAEFTKATGVSALDEEMTADEDSNNLVKLARSQGMNTEVRRGIFVVLMSSDDYIDACERLSQLSLSEVQQREIIRVLLHCCGNESSYNPYYSLVGQQLSRTAHAYKITLQFALWDFLRDLGESTVGGAAVIKNAKDVEFDVKSISKTRIQHVAKAYAWWIAKDCVSLIILKPVDFTRLKTQTRDFFKELCIQIFVNSQQPTPVANSDIKDLVFTRNRNAVEEIFIKVSRVEALAMGLVFFLSRSFPEKDLKLDDGFSKFLKWAAGVAKDTLRTGIDLIPSTVQECI